MTMKFPFVEDTLGKKLEAGTGMSVDCLTCRRHVVLDVAALVERLGPGQPCLHWDLVKVIFCHECRAAGRDDRNLLTNHAATPDKRKGWAMKRERPGRLAWVGQQTPG
ncbi:MAG: hypothetical protein E5V30_00260, partial [Mesorhizobium sp.]